MVEFLRKAFGKVMSRVDRARAKTLPVIPIRTEQEIALLRQAGRTVAGLLARLESACVPGATTQALENIAEVYIRHAGCEPLFLGQSNPQRGGIPFPACLCISVNEEVVHGIPSPRRLREGDLVSIDCGLKERGYCGDTAWTFAVGGQGKLPPDKRQLMDVALETLRMGVRECRPGRVWSEIGALLQNYVERAGFGVVREFVGHGIGKELHEPPQVPNYADSDTRKKMDFVLQPGMVFCIEPMVTMGNPATKVIRDGWTVVTKDGRPAAHFEHMVCVTAGGAEVLTVGGPEEKMVS